MSKLTYTEVGFDETVQLECHREEDKSENEDAEDPVAADEAAVGLPASSSDVLPAPIAAPDPEIELLDTLVQKKPVAEKKNERVNMVHSLVCTVRTQKHGPYRHDGKAEDEIAMEEEFAIPPRPVQGTDHASVGVAVIRNLESYVFGSEIRQRMIEHAF